MSAWTDHVARWKDCARCPLAQQRSNIVIARASALPCDVLIIGEAPGHSEDALGQPFVGPAGMLLDSDSVAKPGILQYALPAHIEGDQWVLDVEVAFTNLVCCFPREAKARGDNEPEHDEILACKPRLEEFIAIARPRLVVLVGRLAGEYVQHDAYGKIGGALAVEIMHPAHILARLPLVQKRYAVDKCIAAIRSAWAKVAVVK